MTTDVEKRARTALATSPISALRDLDVERQGEQLLISGRVRSFYHKQLAQELVLAVASELHIVNSVDVRYEE